MRVLPIMSALVLGLAGGSAMKGPAMAETSPLPDDAELMLDFSSFPERGGLNWFIVPDGAAMVCGLTEAAPREELGAGAQGTFYGALRPAPVQAGFVRLAAFDAGGAVLEEIEVPSDHSDLRVRISEVEAFCLPPEEIHAFLGVIEGTVVAILSPM